MNLNKYIALKQGVRLHITPEYCLLIDLGKRRLNFFNQESISFLKNCTGEKTTSQLIKRFYLREWEDDKKALMQFINYMGDNWVELYETSVKKEIDIKGTDNYFVPIHASIELTGQCNFNCSYCYNSHFRGNELLTNEWISLLKKLASTGMHTIEITGGEPTMRKDFWTIFDAIKDNFNQIAVLSNGSFDNDFFNSLLKNKKYINAVNISLDTINEDLFNQITGTKGCLGKVLENIKKLSDNGFLVRVVSVLTPGNDKEVLNVAKYTWANNLGYFSFSPALPFGKTKLNMWEDNKMNDKVFEITTFIRENYPGLMQVYSQDDIDNKLIMGNCGLGHKNITVSPTGKIRACTMIEESKENIIGDCTVSSLEEIYASNKMRFFQNLKSPNVSECRNCKYAYYCANCVIRPISAMKENKKICWWGLENNIQDNYGEFSDFEVIDYFERTENDKISEHNKKL